MIPFNILNYQPAAWRTLARSFEADRLTGAYLFHGPEGTGHWALGISLAALVNCRKPEKSGEMLLIPCGQCRSCRNIYSLNFEGLHFALPIPPHKNFEEAIELTVKLLEIKRAEPFTIFSLAANTNIPIAMARDIKRQLSRRSTSDVKRIVIFYRMERMLSSSTDALLKLIEEPPADTIMILTARRPDSLLPTIQSRTRKIRLGRIPEEAIKNYLADKYNLTEKRAGLLARLADGSLGNALGMIEAPDDEELSQRAVGFLLFKSLLRESSPEVISRITDFLNPRDRGQTEALLTLWQSLTRDCSDYAVSGSEDGIVNIDFRSEIIKLSGNFSDNRLSRQIANNIKITLADLRRNVHIHGALTALVLRIKQS